MLTDNTVLLIQEGGAVWNAELLSSAPGRAGPARLPGWGHESGGGVLGGHECSGVVCGGRPGGLGVTLCQTSVGVRRLGGGVHPGCC